MSWSYQIWGITFFFNYSGERPYQCQTCDRTFTLKHSLVRHQRIHKKNPDDRGVDEADGAREDSAVDGEDLRCSSGSESETSKTENSKQAEETIEAVDDAAVKQEETSRADASNELQMKELDELDIKAPEPKDATDPSLKDNQGAADKPVV